MSQAITPVSRVTLHFALKLEDGQVVDSTFERPEPVTFSMGDGSLPVGFEKYLLGLKAGDQQQFQIPPEDAFGQPNPSNIQRFKPDQFDSDTPLEVGLVFSFADPSGELPGVISEVSEREVVVDFNHPLAGRTLTFDVAIHQVEGVL